MEVAGKRVTVMGLGRHGGGVGAARWLAQQGARVTITDQLPADALEASIAMLAGIPIESWKLGGHDEQSCCTCDWLVVNPAVRPGESLVQRAAQCGARITSEIELFLSRCPARIAGVTGSVGKSSTAWMLHHIFQAAGMRSWLGGNLGGSLLSDLAAMQPDDWVVLELSSFQLHWLSRGMRMPALAVVTNCQPNHLDWHGTLEHYRQSKQRLLAGQRPGDRYVLGSRLASDPAWQGPWPGRALAAWPLERIGPLTVVGRHQRENAALAAAAAEAAGCDPAAIATGLAAFSGLPHRLQWVGRQGGRNVVDDSKATTPASTLAAIEAIERRAWWLIGGADKGSEFEPLLARLAECAEGAAFYGATGPRLFELAQSRWPQLNCALRETLDAALGWCWRSSAVDDWVVLSPACASLDQFRDYAERGEVFRAECARLAIEERAWH
ncbi:MAG TPA: Mur ligase family protein [Pirellulales bacterium]|jgi:UDP-N-acetylmuramoylalanine--D-glutamate ligase|nr:Mur ligase family protein [Pirellulales bacterium]